MNQRALPGIIIILVILLGGVAYAAWINIKEKPEPVEQVAPLGTVYTNERLGITLTHPDTYRLDSKVGDTSELLGSISLIDAQAYAELMASTEPAEAPPAILINVFNANGASSVEMWLTENTQYSLYAGEQLVRTQVGTMQAVTYDAEGLYRIQYIALMKEDRIYLFSVEYLERTDSIVSDFTNLIQSVSINI